MKLHISGKASGHKPPIEKKDLLFSIKDLLKQLDICEIIWCCLLTCFIFLLFFLSDEYGYTNQGYEASFLSIEKDFLIGTMSIGVALLAIMFSVSPDTIKKMSSHLDEDNILPIHRVIGNFTFSILMEAFTLVFYIFLNYSKVFHSILLYCNMFLFFFCLFWMLNCIMHIFTIRTFITI